MDLGWLKDYCWRAALHIDYDSKALQRMLCVDC